MSKEKTELSRVNDDRGSAETILEPIGTKGSYGEPDANQVDVDGYYQFIILFIPIFFNKR